MSRQRIHTIDYVLHDNEEGEERGGGRTVQWLNGSSIHIKLVRIFVWAMNTTTFMWMEKDNISLVMII